MVKVVTYILGNNATIQGLVGTKDEPQTDDYYKIYPVVAPSTETAPYCVVRLASKARMGRDCDFTFGVQVVSYAKSYDEVTTLNDAVISVLEGQAAATINGQAFGYLNMTNEQDDFIKEHSLYAKITTFEGAAT